MKMIAWLLCSAALAAAFAPIDASASGPVPITSREAYRMVMGAPAKTFIIDVRTEAEYEFVGHPDLPNGVPNIPFAFYPSWQRNPRFVEDVGARFPDRSVTLITICRSGKRALDAAALLTGAGYRSVYYMTDSFEGAADDRGHRTIDGWKNNGLPYTYKLDRSLTYGR